MKIAFVTCVDIPEQDPDEQMQLDAAAAAGHEASVIAWDDAKHDPGAHDVCVLRSTWNYYGSLDRFMEWIDRASARTLLLNGRKTVQWNIHKGYLAQLAAAGVSTVPTRFVRRGSEPSLTELCAEAGWVDVVVKPTVSAGSYLTKRFRGREIESHGEKYLALHAITRDMMIQGYVPSVESVGERCIVVIDGEPTHAVRKEPRFHGADESVTGPFPVSEAERRLLDAALAVAPIDRSDLLYARLDVMDDADGQPMVSELELIEPSLFFLQHPPALKQFIDGIERMAIRARIVTRATP